MTKPQQYVVRDGQWHYLSLEVTPDPQVYQNDILAAEYEQVEIDSITWKSVILSCLSKAYGLIGEGSHFDILSNKNKSSVVRIHVLDQEKFINSLLANTFKLNKFYGESITGGDVNCYIRVVKHSDYLGVVADELS